MMTQHKQSGLKIVPPVKCDLEEVIAVCTVQCVLCVWSVLLCGAVGSEPDLHQRIRSTGIGCLFLIGGARGTPGGNLCRQHSNSTQLT